MVNPYRCNPHAGVICERCKYKLNTTFSLANEMHRHETTSKNHSTNESSMGLRMDFVDQINKEMDALAETVSSVSDDVAKSILSDFLNEPSMYPYCSECKILVIDKRTHKRGKHYTFCSELRSGCSIKLWEKNDPKVVPFPFDLQDSTIFCAEFWQCFQEKLSSKNQMYSNDSENSADNVHAEVLAVIDTPAQLAFDEIIATQNARFQVDPANMIIEIHDHFAEPNLWLIRTGYDIHLQGLNLTDLYKVATVPLTDEEIDIRRICSRIEQLTDSAIAFAKSIDRSNLVLLEVKRIDHRPTNKPFSTTLKPETWEKYKRVLEKVATVIFRLVSGDPQRQRYQLTDEQKSLFQTAMDDHDNHQTDQFYVDLLFSLLRQRIIEQSYECILLSALAVMSLKDKAAYMTPNDVTPLYAALIALFRVLILYAARNFPHNPNGFLENTSMLTNALMIHPESTKNPGAMAWIFHTFSYAKVISQNTLQPGRCYWDSDILVYRGAIRFSVVQFRLMLTHFISEAKSLIANLLMLPNDHTSLDVPNVRWDCIIDDTNNTTEGYSFLSDARNTWIKDKENFLVQKVRSDPNLAEKWYDAAANAINHSTLEMYNVNLEKLRRILFGLIHFTAGQPGRGTELTNLRFENGQTARNIVIDRRLVAIRTSYHKMMIQTEVAKNIYRYLPPNVGELLVLYLWLILPFWQTMLGSTLQSKEKSKYLWSKDAVFPGNKIVARNDLWDTTKLSSILNSMTKATMGVEMNVSSWRHIAIAISRRFLRRVLSDPTDEDDDDDEYEDINVDVNRNRRNVPPRILDSVYDLQASHKSRTAFNIYARPINSPSETPSDMIDAYRHVSLEWHKLLFPDLIITSSNKNDDLNDSYRSFMLTLRQRRLTDLANVDLTNRLRLFLNRIDTDFRGNQKEVIQAVVRGESVVLQVAATGSGKSFSFMLPAFCSPDGTTIVIVPLVSLQTDMVRRCVENNITASIWNDSCAYTSPMLLFVTPESAVSKAFLDYVSMLLYSHKLDRIVLDECHSVLFGGEDFRPKFQDLKHLLQRTGVQVLLLTATLPEKFEFDLIQFLGLESRSASKFRESTSRSNIQYVVAKESSDRDRWLSAIKSEVTSELHRGKCIVYCRRRDDGFFVASNLSVPFYHSMCGTNEEKVAMIEEFKNNGTIMVATSALGLGVDLQDVSLTIHIGSPRLLLDFVQESGRAGRDGRSSKSILISLPFDTMDDDMSEYIHCNTCRREILDKHMDGTRRTNGCRNHESRCDRCDFMPLKTPNKTDAVNNTAGRTTGPFAGRSTSHYLPCGSFANPSTNPGAIGVTPDTQNDLDIANWDDESFLQFCDQVDPLAKLRQKRISDIAENDDNLPQRKQRLITEDSVQASITQESRLRQQYMNKEQVCQRNADSCLDLLTEIKAAVSAKGKCLQCYIRGTPTCISEHKNINRTVQERCRSIVSSLRGKSFPKYTACYGRDCFLPQALCAAWELTPNGGYNKSGKACQFPNILLPTIVSLILADKEMNRILVKMIKDQGVENQESLFTKEVPGKWNGIQTTYLFVAFFEIFSSHKHKHKLA